MEFVGRIRVFFFGRDFVGGFFSIVIGRLFMCFVNWLLVVRSVEFLGRCGVGVYFGVFSGVCVFR